MKQVSKLRNVYGDPKKEKFTDVRMAEVTSEGSLLAVNSTFLAVSWQGVGGCVGVFDANTPNRISSEIPLIRGHDSYVSDVKFSPFRTNLLATGSDDTTIKLWEIPQEGLKEDLTNELQKFTGHSRKVSNVEFNPVCNDIIASAAFDNTVQVWNMVKSEAFCKISFGTPTSLEWNYNGSLVGATTKEKMCYIIDPRANKITITTKAHESPKIQKMCFIDENHFITCGFNKNSMREIKLFDMRKAAEGALEEAVGKIDVDRQSGIMSPFYDDGLKLLYVPGRGEGNIHYYDLSDLQIKECSEYKSSQPQKAITMFPKKTMDYNKCEVARFAKVVGKEIMYLGFFVPRRNPGYDSSLYPPVYTGEPAITTDEWMGGANKDPIVKEINTIENKWVSEPMKFEKKVEEVKKTSEEEIKELKLKVEQLEQKVQALEGEKEQLQNQVTALEKENETLKAQSQPATTTEEQA